VRYLRQGAFLCFIFLPKNIKRQHANPGEGFIFLL
jgi:hypothetical protein